MENYRLIAIYIYKYINTYIDINLYINIYIIIIIIEYIAMMGIKQYLFDLLSPVECKLFM